MKKQVRKDKPTLDELKEFWDGPKVGFNVDLYEKYLKAKKAWRAKMN
jgi:hypothetical protein